MILIAGRSGARLINTGHATRHKIIITGSDAAKIFSLRRIDESAAQYIVIINMYGRIAVISLTNPAEIFENVNAIAADIPVSRLSTNG